jgi:transposase
MGKHLDETVKASIVALRNCGYSLGRIGSILHLSKATVQVVLKNFNDRGTVINKKNSGRPLKVSPTSQRAICRHSLSRRREPLRNITSYYNSGAMQTVSQRTVRRILHARGIGGFAAAKKLPLSSFIRMSRIRWCRAMKQHDANFWRSIIFSDETRVGLTSDGRVHVWRRRGERHHPDCITARSRTQRTIMFWGCVTYDGQGELIRCSNNMNSSEYCTVLEKAGVHVSNDFGLIFQDDNAPIHKSQETFLWK